MPGQVDGRALVGEADRAVLGVQHREGADDAARRCAAPRSSARPAGRCAGRRRRASAAAAWPPARPRRARPSPGRARPASWPTGPTSGPDQRVDVDLRDRGLRGVGARCRRDRPPGRRRRAVPGRPGRRRRARPGRASTSSSRTDRRQRVARHVVERRGDHAHGRRGWARAHGTCSAARHTGSLVALRAVARSSCDLRQPCLDLVGPALVELGLRRSVKTSLADSSARTACSPRYASQHGGDHQDREGDQDAGDDASRDAARDGCAGAAPGRGRRRPGASASRPGRRQSRSPDDRHMSDIAADTPCGAIHPVSRGASGGPRPPAHRAGRRSRHGGP